MFARRPKITAPGKFLCKEDLSIFRSEFSSRDCDWKVVMGEAKNKAHAKPDSSFNLFRWISA